MLLGAGALQGEQAPQGLRVPCPLPTRVLLGPAQLHTHRGTSGSSSIAPRSCQADAGRGMRMTKAGSWLPADLYAWLLRSSQHRVAHMFLRS